MKLIKVAAAVLNQTPLDWLGNQNNIMGAISAAKAQGATILCLPELCITGYGCEDAFHSEGVQRMALRIMEECLPATRGMIVSFGLPLLVKNSLFNVACLVADGRVLGFVAKQHLAGDGIHYEPRWFKPWPAGLQSQIALNGKEYPLGDLFFDLGGVRIGFEICEDAWVAQRPGAALAKRGVDIILNPSASHFAFGKLEVRKRFVLEGSRAFGVSYVYANLLGNEAGRSIYDGEAMIATCGRMVATGPRFSFREFLVSSAVVDLDATRLNQARTASFEPDLGSSDQACVRAPFEFPKTAPEKPVLSHEAWEDSRHLKEEEFARAEALALFDYLRKSKSRGFVVSLSGGADSSAITCLVRIMGELAVGELGLDGVQNRLAYIPDVKSCTSVDDLMKVLLTTAYQATRNSGPVTRAAAKAVSAFVGAVHHELDVTTIHESYLEMVSKAMGRELSWATDDLALQNIQARVRSPGIWLLTNLKGALLLSTSNRSEAAVGYATMDGDTSGGLSPIAGIDKAFLRTWLVWLQKHGVTGLKPFPALEAVTAQAPTAELRPSTSKQTDEDDLMPYVLLDAVERAAIRDKKTPIEVYQIMRLEFPQYAAKQLGHWVERFFRLWCRNQWKRERYAPSFHLDDENLDPKTWCRFPILSGGYEWELRELREYVERHAAD